MKQFLYSLSMAFLAIGTANASIVVTNVASTTAGQPAGETQWTYTFSLQPDQNMRQTCGGTCSYTNDFATLYDFFGYVGGSANITAIVARTFTLTTENTSIQAPLQGVPDNGGIENFRISLTGGGDIAGGGVTPTDLFTLTLNSSNPGAFGSGQAVFYSAQAQNATTSTTAGNSSTTQGPLAATPEPASFALSGLGLLAVAFAGRKRA